MILFIFPFLNLYNISYCANKIAYISQTETQLYIILMKNAFNQECKYILCNIKIATEKLIVPQIISCNLEMCPFIVQYYTKIAGAGGIYFAMCSLFII